jgi:glycine C-acetyltransferase
MWRTRDQSNGDPRPNGRLTGGVVYGALRDDLAGRLEEVREAGLYKTELAMTTPQGAHVDVDGRELLNLCANNYLGLAAHPAIVEAAHEALERWGYGMASVRFICGTQMLHRDLEQRLSFFLGTADTILFSSCFDANGGLFEALLEEQDAVISDQLNHASIIDGVRLCKARRLRYANGDMDELEARLVEATDARYRLIATDGVFSMDGYLAKLDRICDLAERYDALVMVDDSHAVGVIGPHGLGSHDHHGVVERVDILTGTLGKAIGGAAGGYVSGRREIIEILRQRARPYLFSNSLAPPVVGASLRAIDLIQSSGDLRDRLRENTAHFRSRMTELGFELLPGEHPIVPVMIGEEVKAAHLSAKLVELGVYAVSFSYPVVPRGTARIRTQMSAAHTLVDLDFAVDCFQEARDTLFAS